MQNETGKFKGTIVSPGQVFKGSSDGVFPLETQTQSDGGATQSVSAKWGDETKTWESKQSLKAL